jgi:hypothetical protein
MSIRDSRTLYGPLPHASTAEVEAHWHEYGATRGWWDPVTGVRTPGEVIVSNDTLPAYVSDNRWVAQCPCGGGIGCWTEMSRGCCYDCGTSYLIAFPAAKACADAVDVLTARPEPETRNWRPDRGESVADLKVENVKRGLRLYGREKIDGLD